jgi:hypothetical protein
MNRPILLFAYDPRQHGMFRERVPVEQLAARVDQLRAAGWEVSHLPSEPREIQKGATP